MKNKNNTIGIRDAFHEIAEREELEMARQVRGQLQRAMQQRFDAMMQNL